jgi:hypothetical protein
MTLLKEIAHIRAGHPFRGRIESLADGAARVIQMKDVDPVQGVSWGELAATELTGRKEPDWLKPGDVLFAARGNRYYALLLDDVPFDAVPSPHFFHLTVKPGAKVLPAFLAWQINQEPAQQYLQKSSHGSMVQAINRQVLDDMPIAMLPLPQQEIVVRLQNAWRQELRLFQTLTENTQRTMTGIARQLMRDDY